MLKRKRRRKTKTTISLRAIRKKTQPFLGIINVSTAKRNEKYFCPICGELMNPHMGKVRRWHFVHKNAGNCSYESYLHKLAKIKIRENTAKIFRRTNWGYIWLYPFYLVNL